MQAADQGGEPLEPRAGRLLVAAPSLVDPNFARTIVLLLDTDPDGVLGVVLNRPSRVAVGEVLEPWEDAVAEPPVLFHGGPVGTDSALAVANLAGRVAPEDPPVGWRQLFANTGLVDLDAPHEVVAPAVGGMRIYAGYAGWGAGQLDAEIAEGAWYVVPGLPGDLFLREPADLWRQVLRRQGGSLAWLATYPADPTQN